MDIPKIKDLAQKLGFLRNYSSLLLPVIIILVAVLLFIPTQLLSGKLKKRVENESSSIGRRIRLLSENPVSHSQWEIERKYQQDYRRDANQMVLLAVQSSQRPLLSYKIFPNPKDTSTLIFKEFGWQFRSAVEGLIARMNALDCPTDAELQRSLQGAGSSFSRDMSTIRGGADTRTSEINATITDVLCREKAKRASVYANPTDLSGYEFWEEYEYTGMSAAIENCWYWQLAYWVMEDVIDTVDALNFGSNTVFTSPVKRLMGISFAAADKGAGARPSYVLSTKDGLTQSLTRRVCSDDIDVVHFNVVVVVNAEVILPFMQQLCSAKQHRFRGFSGEDQEQVFKHNQITVLESIIRPIDRASGAHELYRYGEDAVVELDLICEYVFNKNGYDEIKPESVKELLKAAQEGAENVSY
jgi:hypothetical protein